MTSATDPPVRLVGAPIGLVLVEEADVAREELAVQLSAHGCQVLAAVGTLRQGRADIRRCRPQVAVVDSHLPDGWGIDLCADLTVELPDMILLLHAALPTDEMVRRAADCGVHDVVAKTLRTDTLLRAIRHHVGLHASGAAGREPAADVPRLPGPR